MPTLEVEKPNRRLRPWMVAVLAVLTGLLLAGVAWGLWQWRLDVDKAAYESAQATERTAGLTQDYAGAAKAWQNYRKGLPPHRYLYESYISEGALQETMQKFPEALSAYRNAESVRKGNGTAEYNGIARVSERLGDIPTAIKYYKKAGDTYASYKQGRAESDWMYSHAAQLEKSQGASNAVK